jgi:hypothetical protein
VSGAYLAGRGQAPVVTAMRVVPVAGRDSMLLAPVFPKRTAENKMQIGDIPMTLWPAYQY